MVSLVKSSDEQFFLKNFIILYPAVLDHDSLSTYALLVLIQCPVRRGFIVSPISTRVMNSDSNEIEQGQHGRIQNDGTGLDLFAFSTCTSPPRVTPDGMTEPGAKKRSVPEDQQGREQGKTSGWED